MHTAILLSTTALALSTLAAATPTGRKWATWKQKGPSHDSPFEFTSTYHVIAVPEQVVNGTPAVSTPGQPGALGYYNYGINSVLDVICYNITLHGVSGPYQSAAKTATHIHEAVSGANGPPRITLPNPEGDDQVRRSVGCLSGPFTTGLLGADGVDTGVGFTVAQIEKNPAGFFTDSHTAKYVPGVVRGQLGGR